MIWILKSKKFREQIKKSLTGGKAAVKSLKKEKVEHVFGLIGSATMEMFDALYHEKTIKFIGVRDERTGTHMADGYARASNKPGVILAGQNGPGATNLVRGIAQAKAALKCNKPAVIDVDVDPKALYSFRRDSFKHRIK